MLFHRIVKQRTQVIESERGKVAGKWLELERRKWRDEFDLQIKRTRENAESECAASQHACRRDIIVCNLTVADLRHQRDSQLRRQNVRRSVLQQDAVCCSGLQWVAVGWCRS